MAHIHELIDFTIATFIVHKGKVIFIHHKQLNKWLPVGGHIELVENPEEGLFREIKEETGLTKDKLTVLSSKPKYKSSEQKYLFTPNLLDIHKISESHQHIGIMYFVRSSSDKIKHAKDEHNHIRWLTKSDLKRKEYQIRDDIVYAAEKAIELEASFK